MLIFISKVSTFLPRYSGVRPTMRPAMNTVSRANTSMPYRPAPTPPGVISPRSIRNRGTRPPSGVKLSCIELTAPVLVPVVIAAHRPPADAPNRSSLPSMLPSAWSTPAGNSGLPCDSATIAPVAATARRTPMAANTAQPWRRSPASTPKVAVSEKGITRMSTCSSRLVRAVGFSKGWAELAFTMPPPLVPSSLIASCEAMGPR